jgi:GNAT superfamily N-acetyltransferase
MLEDSAKRIAAMQEALVADGLLEPLRTDERETAAWLDHELASFVENRLGTAVDPWRITPLRRAEWLPRATGEARLRSPHRSHAAPFWVVDAGRPIGTIALSTLACSAGLPYLASFYIHPARRRQGHGRQVLAAVGDAAIRAGLSGVRLETEWCWQPAVRFYAASALWVAGWKRELVFVRRRDLPSWRLELDGDEADFVVNESRASRPQVIIRARRQGARLYLREKALMRNGNVVSPEIGFLAPGTFALALALQGWPLITEDEKWQRQLRQGWSDFGGLEALAFKIRLWEAWTRRQGWRVATPRIPGLDYPDWSSVQREREMLPSSKPEHSD